MEALVLILGIGFIFQSLINFGVMIHTTKVLKLNREIIELNEKIMKTNQNT